MKTAIEAVVSGKPTSVIAKKYNIDQRHLAHKVYEFQLSEGLQIMPHARIISVSVPGMEEDGSMSVFSFDHLGHIVVGKPVGIDDMWEWDFDMGDDL